MAAMINTNTFLLPFLLPLYAIGRLAEKNGFTSFSKKVYELTSPLGFRAAYRLGMFYFLKKKWLDASNFFERAAKDRPDNARVNFRLVQCYQRLNDEKRRDYYLKKLSTINPKETLKVSPSLAEQALRNLIEEGDIAAELYALLASSLNKQGKTWQEIEALKSAVELDQGEATWHHRLGEALEKMKRYRAAATSYQAAIYLSPQNCRWYYDLGFACECEGHDGPAELERAAHAYRKAIELDRDLGSQELGIGAFHQVYGRWSYAATAYELLLQGKPTNAVLNFRLGMAYDRCYEWNKAEFAYRKALDRDPDNGDWCFRLGFVLERQEKLEEAACVYARAALQKKNSAETHYRHAYVLTKLGHYEEACRAFFASHLISKNNNFYLTIKSLFLKKKKVSFFLEQLKQDATKADVYYHLGHAYAQAKEWHNAACAFDAALARKSEHQSEWVYNLGFALFKQGHYEKAAETLLELQVLKRPYGVSVTKFKNNHLFRRRAIYADLFENSIVLNKMIMYESFHGVSISCNPYAIFLSLLNKDEFSGHSHVWAINDFSTIPADLLKLHNVIFVKRDSYRYLKYLASAKVLVNNTSFPDYFIRKSDQLYLNTWHGTPWKMLGRDINDDFFGGRNITRNFNHATHLIFPNKYTEEIIKNSYEIGLHTTARIKTVGYPRNDLTVNASADQRRRLRSRLGLSPGKKTILYAPTWRGTLGSVRLESDVYLNVVQRLKSLDCNLLFRGHYFVESALSDTGLRDCLIPNDITSNELLSIVDVLITDYSSIAFDFMVTGRPIVYYLSDYDEYRRERGLYFPAERLPGVVCYTSAELVEHTRQLVDTEGEVHERYESVRETFCACEDGKATQRAIDFIFSNGNYECVRPKKTILIYAGAFLPNGITSSLVSLLADIDKSKYEIILAVDSAIILSQSENMEQFRRLPPCARVVTRVGEPNLTIEEAWVYHKFLRENSLPSPAMYEVLQKCFAREFQRIFGMSHFDHIINFDGYSRFWSILFAYAPKKAVIYLHNNMYEEWREKFPSQESVFSLSKHYGRLVSVSKQTHLGNRAMLASRFSIDPNKFTYADNLIDVDSIMDSANREIEKLEESKALNDCRPLYINMARLSVEKGHATLIRAFKEFLDSGGSGKLIILGDGPLRMQLRFLIKQLNLEETVLLLGRKSNPFPYLKRADCFVFSSKHEGQGLVLLEAMVLGVPIVCTDFACAHDVLDGGHGLIVENSVAGLKKGMEEFAKGNLPPPRFDYEEYRARARNMFYKRVLSRHSDSLEAQ